MVNQPAYLEIQFLHLVSCVVVVVAAVVDFAAHSDLLLVVVIVARNLKMTISEN